MLNTDVRSLIFSAKLAEESVSIPAWSGANLFIRELSGAAGTALIKMCTNADGSVDQDNFVAGIILATLRNADDGGKLVFGMENEDVPNPAYRDGLMATGLGTIMEVAKQSIALSGLNEAVAVDNAKNASSETSAASSPTTSQAA